MNKEDEPVVDNFILCLNAGLYNHPKTAQNLNVLFVYEAVSKTLSTSIKTKVDSTSLDPTIIVLKTVLVT